MRPIDFRILDSFDDFITRVEKRRWRDAHEAREANWTGKVSKVAPSAFLRTAPSILLSDRPSSHSLYSAT